MRFNKRYAYAAMVMTVVITTAAYAATITGTFGTNAGPGGAIVLFGPSSGSVTIQTPSAAGTNTLFQLPGGNGTNGNVLSTDGSGVLSWVTAGSGNVTLSGDNVMSGKNTFTGTVVGSHVSIGTSSSVDGNTLCGRTVQYNGGAAGTITLQGNTVPADCSFPIVQIGSFQATIAVAAGAVNGSISSGCNTTPRTKGINSVIWVYIVTNPGSAPVLNVSGDCG